MTPRVHRSRVTHDRWLVSYADFITLLFAFFVVLCAFSKADQKRQADVSSAIDGAFHSMGLFSGPAKGPSTAGAMNVLMSEEVQSPERVRDNLEQVQRDLEQKLAPQIAHRTITIAMGRDGLVISLREAGFFGSGSATPRPQTLDILQQISASVGQTPYDVRVEGHTDNIPIHNNEFDSNWELSAERATRIARLLLGLKAIQPERLSVAGYAEFHPVASNDCPEGRARNRRVDIVVLPRTKTNLAVPHAAAQSGPWARITDN